MSIIPLDPSLTPTEESPMPTIVNSSGVRPEVHARGRKEPGNLAELIRESHARHGERLRALVTPTAPSFDWRAMGKVPPVQDQGQCGSCWDFSGCGTATCAMIQAALWPADGSMVFSEQYYLDCVSDGGCNGDDNTTVLADLMANGAPTIAEYGPYVGGEQACASTAGMTRYKIAAWGFADSEGGQGVTSIADIKKALVTYGPVGCGVAAGDDWDNYTSGVSMGSGSTQINHDVMIVGWKDDATISGGGYWIVRNSWGPEWGMQGYMELAYGADNIGTETVWAQASVHPTPNPTPKPGPSPTPSPTPTPTPAAGLTLAQAVAAIEAGIDDGRPYGLFNVIAKVQEAAISGVTAAWPAG